METTTWKLWDAYDIEAWTVPSLRWHVEPLIPKGTVGFMPGQPKVGKSLLALDRSLALANAHFEQTNWLGKFTCTPANTLYISREDPARRARERALAPLVSDQEPIQPDGGGPCGMARGTDPGTEHRLSGPGRVRPHDPGSG